MTHFLAAGRSGKGEVGDPNRHLRGEPTRLGIHLQNRRSGDI